MRIAVAGGTGLIGRMVVAAARERGHVPVVLSRSSGFDLMTGTGLDKALQSVDAVIDVTNIVTLRRTTFFETVTRNLHTAGQTGVRHHVALSIVGVDRVRVPYYQAKLAQEKLVLDGPIPGTVLRATQFHEFAEQSLARHLGPLLPAPVMRTQPVAAREVAAELVRLATGPAAGMAPEMAGPEVLQMTDMIRRLVKARRLRRLIIPLRVVPAMARDGLLPLGDGPRGTETFGSWLAGAATVSDRR